MKLRMPRYYRQFQCVGGACPDTCCRDWAVVLDKETARYYEAVPGGLGVLLRASISELDGERCLNLNDGLCPMLTDRGLCRVQLELGEARLSRSCGLHPRFFEEYGALREMNLSMGCPEAVRLLLSDRTPLAYVEEVTDEPLSGYNELDARVFFAVSAARETAFAIVQDRKRTISCRSVRLLEFAVRFQKTLDQHRLGRLRGICLRFAAPAAPAAGPEPMPEIPEVFYEMEAINARWPELLAEAGAAPADRWPEFCAADEAGVYEHLLWYFLFRYALKAAVDRKLLPRVKFAVAGVAVIRRLLYARWRGAGSLDTAGRVDCIHRYCREVEHSEDNLRLLLESL